MRIAVSNPFDTAMLNAVRFDAHGPVQFALAPRVDIEKALKKYYGVGAETLDEMDEEMPLDLDLPERQVTLGKDGHIATIGVRERLDAVYAAEPGASDLDPLLPMHLHIQAICKARHDGAGAGSDGVGILEQLVIGPHAPSGFKGMLDGAE